MKKWLWIGVTLLLVASCNLFDSGVQFDYAAFQSQRDEWRRLAVSNYAFDYYSSGFSYEYVRVYVSNGSYAVSVPYADSMRQSYDQSLEDIFDEIESRYLKNNGQFHWSSEMYLTGIEVSYDPVYHFPTNVYYKYYIPDNLAVDGNFGFSILNFTNE